MPEGDDPLYEAIEALRARGHRVEPNEDFMRWRVDGGAWLDEPAVIASAAGLTDGARRPRQPSALATNPTVADLLKSQAVTVEEVNAGVAAVLADLKIGLFELSPGWIVDLTAAVKADRHALATLREPTAKAGSKRAAVRSAILLAHPVVG